MPFPPTPPTTTHTTTLAALRQASMRMQIAASEQAGERHMQSQQLQIVNDAQNERRFQATSLTLTLTLTLTLSLTLTLTRRR